MNNAKQLTAQWSFSFGVLEGQTTTPSGQQRGDVRYLSWSKVFALDAKTARCCGAMILRSLRRRQICMLRCRQSRCALYQDKVYLATLTCTSSPDAKTGKVVWERRWLTTKMLYVHRCAAGH